MKKLSTLHSYLFILLFAMVFTSCKEQTHTQETATTTESEHPKEIADPLPSWNEGKAKQAIIDFVTNSTTVGHPDFIEKSDRIVTTDNDGTLWSEQPMYFQLFFALDRIKALAPEHPEWKNKQPYKAVLENDMKTLMAQGEKGLLEIVMTTHAGMSTDEFAGIVKDWIGTAEHPIKKKKYTELIFQPMLELVKYFQANEFKTFIVSGGGIEFMRPWAEEVYGIPSENVIGSSIKTKYSYNDGKPTITRLAEIDLIDDKDGKPVGINRYIGRKPVVAIGNSDGDLQMMHWAESNPIKNLQIYVHHTDSIREWKYDRQSHIGTFDKALDEATDKGWDIVDMAKDWKVIYPYELKN
ncbi:HAD family hydrolase [Formosa haliotis]|uniref:HAD family hydrolase n=1 Tax=Formosa haliotis TaxID=1555194 RepID=UPI0008241530|nr:HAD family hydrolase [Formosa haliotis]